RIPQHRSVRIDDERQFAGFRGISNDQFGRFWIRVRIKEMVRVAVAAQKILEMDDAGRGWRANQNRTTGLGLNQADATKDQGPHNTLTEFRLGYQQVAYPLEQDQQRLDMPLCAAVDQTASSQQRPDFGQELAGSLVNDRR